MDSYPGNADVEVSVSLRDIPGCVLPSAATFMQRTVRNRRLNTHGWGEFPQAPLARRCGICLRSWDASQLLGSALVARGAERSDAGVHNKTGHWSNMISTRRSMRISAWELPYVGGDHWATVLDNIADLKDHFDREEQLRLVNNHDQIQDKGGDGDGGDSLMRPQSPHALLLYGRRRSASRAEILAALPVKATVDRYISRYFNRLDLVASCRCALLHYNAA